jgi:hypothetical protein
MADLSKPESAVWHLASKETLMYMKATSIFRRVSYALALAALFVLAAAATKADETYTYTSSPYTDWYVFVPCPSTNICETTGSLTFATALPDNMSLQAVTPESYSFTDGVTVLDSTNSSIFELELATNASGQITEWDYFFTQGNPEVDLFELCGNDVAIGCGLAGLQSGNFDYYDQAEYDINNSPNFFIEYAVSGGGPGVWTGGGSDQSGSGGGDGNGTNVPEPSVVSMLSLGLVSLLGRGAWRRHAGGQLAA